MTSRTLLACSIGALLCTAQGCNLAADSSEPAGSEDTSVTIEPIVGGERTTSYPEAALLNMRSTAGAYYACSAVLISPRVVLTAGHCVDGMASWEIDVGGVHASSTHAETYDWHENGAASVNPAHHDVGLVYLDRAIQIPTFPTIARAPVASGARLVDVGRIVDGTLTNSFYRATVSAGDGAAIGYRYDYYARDVIEHGDSGGPVFIPATHTIVAVASGANSTIEVLARVDLVGGWIADRIAATAVPTDGGAAGAAGDGGAIAEAGAIADAGSAPSAGDPARASDSGACTQEVEPNDLVGQAHRLDGRQCGALRPGADVDWFVFGAKSGITKIALVPGADAVLSVGYLTPQMTCSLVVIPGAKYRAVTITVSGSPSARMPDGNAAVGQPPQICLAVSSPGQVVQDYAVSVTR